MLFKEYLLEKFGIEEELPISITSHKFKKGELITRLGTVERNIYYVVSGIVESCIPTSTGERIMEIAFSGHMATALSSLLTEQPSDVCIVCLKECEVEAIPFAKLKEACETSAAANKFYISFLEHVYLKRIQKEKTFLTKNAEERYLDLITKRPDIIQEISIDHIAKYLGMNSHSLSRIRRKIAQNGEVAPD